MCIRDSNYGNSAFDIVDTIDSGDLNLETITMAELVFTIVNESVRTLMDFYERRTGRLYFEIASIIPTLDSVTALASRRLKWNKERTLRESQSVQDAVINQTKYISELETA